MRALPVLKRTDAVPFGGIALSLGHSDARPLPMTPDEVRARGWDELDVVFITGDAYVDHPSFAMALLGRLLESAGYRVGIVSQPDWRSAAAFRALGRPRLFFAVSAGNMDSMINHYTANKKVRNDDAYSPGGRIGLRPDRATLAYCQRAREAFPGVPIVAGGVEASLRRIAHYDYWSDTVRRSIVLDAKADLVGFGMGERGILDIARRLAAGESVRDLRDLRGVAYRLGAKEPAPPDDDTVVTLPSYEKVERDPVAFANMTRLAHRETNPLNARALVQAHGPETVVVNPPALPLTEAEMDWVYGLPYTRRPHASYGTDKIPAFDVVKTSVQIMRGCFGGCTFCSITAHEGRIIQSRSRESVIGEIRRMTKDEGFSGVVSDIGGPTANMYQMRCTRPEVEEKCKRQSCVHPKVCKLLGTDHGPLIDLMRQSRAVKGVRKVFVASGIRMDLAQLDPAYVREIAEHHVGGLLKVAPEHTDPAVLELMKKPGPEDFLAFDREFTKASERAGKKQHLVPYFIASHPGSSVTSDDRSRAVLEAERLSPGSGARLHSEPVRRRDVHVPHRLRPDDHAAREDGARTPRPEDAARAPSILEARQLVLRTRRTGQSATPGAHRRRLRLSHPVAASARGCRRATRSSDPRVRWAAPQRLRARDERRLSAETSDRAAESAELDSSLVAPQ